MTGRPWSAAERRRFELGVVEALGDSGVPCEPVPGSLRVTLGGGAVAGAAVVVTWASHATGKLTQHRDSSIPPAELGRILQRAADKLPAEPVPVAPEGGTAGG